MRSLPLLFWIVLCCANAAGQNLDSLRSVWQDQQRPDTSRMNASFDLALGLSAIGNNDSALVVARQNLVLAETNGSPKRLGGSWKLISNLLADLGDYDGSRAALDKSMAFWSSVKDLTRMGDCEISYGYTYILQGAYTLGMEHNLKALDLYTSKPDSAGMSHAENNLSALYAALKDYDKAIEHNTKALEIMTARKDPRVANAISGLASAYQKKGDLPRALKGYDESLQLFLAAKDLDGAGRVWNAKSGLFLALGLPDSALAAAQRSLQLTKQNFQIIQTSLNESRALQRLARWREALAPAQLAERLATEAGSLDFRATAYLELSNVHEALGDKTRALDEYRLFVQLNDSVRNEENTKEQTRMEMTHLFDREQLADSLANAAEKERMTLENEAQVARERNRRNVLLFSGIGLLGLAGGLYTRLRYTRKSRAAIQKEKDISEGLLLNILPAEVAEELKRKGYADAQHFDTATILFTDFKGFTQASEKLTPQELVEELNVCFKAFDHIITTHGIEKIKTIGDAYMCAGGLPDPSTSSPKSVVFAALEMQAFMVARKAERDTLGNPAFEMRLGIHTGPVVAGIVGVKKFQYDI